MPPGLKFTDLQLREQGVPNDCVTLTHPPERVAAPEGGEALLEETLSEDHHKHQTSRAGGVLDGTPSIRGSHVYEINAWLWNIGSSQPRVGGLSAAKTEKIRRKSRSETSRRAWETRKASKLAAEDILV